MTIQFKNGTTKKCTSLAEQKLFRGGEPVGWLCSIVVSDAACTSDELDELLTPDNVSALTFFNTDAYKLFEINGYSKVSSAVIRYSENNGAVEIQLQKEDADGSF